jgi:multimeric flavodoxin WrbA
MRIVVINAAPRMEAGNTQVMLTPFLVGCRGEGADVDMALLGRKEINACIGCFTCYAETPGVCIHSDDMPALMERISRADLMVLATPVYIDGMTSLTKIFWDRMVAFLDPHFTVGDGTVSHPLRRRFPGKLFLVSVCGYPGLRNFDPLLLHMERLARNFHTEFTGALLRPAAFSLLMGKKYGDRIKDVMDAARKAGRQLVRHGEVSPETLSAAAGDICSQDELVRTANAYWDRLLGESGDRPA